MKKRISLGIVGIIVTNVLAIVMTISFYFIGRHVPPEFKEEFSEVAGIQETGRFNEAIEEYKALHSKYAVESCYLYYNIGNAYYDLGQYGMALLYFKKAEELKPGDRQVKHNIRHVEEKLNVDNWVPEKKEGFFRKHLIRLLGVYSIYGWTIFSVANYWRFCISIMLLFFFGRRPRFFIYLALVLGFIFVIGLCLTGGRAWLDLTTRKGVVLDSESSVRYEHDEAGQVAFTVRRGMVVGIVSEWHEWREIRLNTGRSGWVMHDAIGGI